MDRFAIICGAQRETTPTMRLAFRSAAQLALRLSATVRVEDRRATGFPFAWEFRADGTFEEAERFEPEEMDEGLTSQTKRR